MCPSEVEVERDAEPFGLEAGQNAILKREGRDGAVIEARRFGEGGLEEGQRPREGGEGKVELSDDRRSLDADPSRIHPLGFLETESADRRRGKASFRLS